jgi:hypothetical protein
MQSREPEMIYAKRSCFARSGFEPAIRQDHSGILVPPLVRGLRHSAVLAATSLTRKPLSKNPLDCRSLAAARIGGHSSGE